MSWLFSQVLVEEYLGENFSDGEPSVPLNGNPTQLAYLSQDKMTVFFRLSRFGMTFKPLTESRGEELLTLYLEDFHARTSQPQEREQELTESDQECGEKWPGSFTKYNPDSRSWKTHQCSLLGDLEPFLETWPRWGLMRDGECWEQPTLEQTTRGTESGFLPTPTASMMPCEGTVRIMRKQWLEGKMSLKEASAIAGRDVRKSQGKVEAWPTPDANCGKRGSQPDLTPARKSGQHAQYTINQAVRDRFFPTPTCHNSKEGAYPSEHNRKTPTLATHAGGKLNPMWVEWLMGWPLEWTDLKPLETAKYHNAQHSHGRY